MDRNHSCFTSGKALTGRINKLLAPVTTEEGVKQLHVVVAGEPRNVQEAIRAGVLVTRCTSGTDDRERAASSGPLVRVPAPCELTANEGCDRA
jgi:hypothetical protein